MDRRNHIFEDPECSAPDEVHPHAHAIKNLGRFLGAVLEEHLEANGPHRWVSCVGIAAVTLLEAARLDPEWANAILDSSTDEKNNDIRRMNGQALLEAFPLSALDRAVRG